MPGHGPRSHDAADASGHGGAEGEEAVEHGAVAGERRRGGEEKGGGGVGDGDAAEGKHADERADVDQGLWAGEGEARKVDRGRAKR